MKKLIFILCCLIGLQLTTYAESVKQQPLTVRTLTQEQLDALIQKDSVQQASIAKLKKENKQLKNRLDNNREQEHKNELLFALSITTVAFTGLIIMLFLKLYFNNRKHQIKYESLDHLITKHPHHIQEIYELLTHDSQTGYRKHLNRGIKLFFLGIGLAIMLGTFNNNSESIGILIACIGAGNIVIGYLQKRDEAQHTLPVTDVQPQPVPQTAPDNLEQQPETTQQTTQPTAEEPENTEK